MFIWLLGDFFNEEAFVLKVFVIFSTRLVRARDSHVPDLVWLDPVSFLLSFLMGTAFLVSTLFIFLFQFFFVLEMIWKTCRSEFLCPSLITWLYLLVSSARCQWSVLANRNLVPPGNLSQLPSMRQSLAAVVLSSYLLGGRMTSHRIPFAAF